MYILGQFIFTCTCKANSKLQVKIYENFDVILLFARLYIDFWSFYGSYQLLTSRHPTTLIYSLMLCGKQTVHQVLDYYKYTWICANVLTDTCMCNSCASVAVVIKSHTS